MAKLLLADAIKKLLIKLWQQQNVIVFGLGVDDPKAIFGTTAGLQVKYGCERVFDTPTSRTL